MIYDVNHVKVPSFDPLRAILVLILTLLRYGLSSFIQT